MRRRHLYGGLVVALLTAGATLIPVSTATAAGTRPDFRAPWPCGQVRDYYHHSSEVHNALDFNIAGSADLGTPALASAPGTVIDAVPVPNSSGYGNYVRVDHGGGWTSLVAHLDRITVSKGQYVRTGDELGKVGTTGQSSGPHLHYEQEADGQNMPIVIDGVALRYSTTAARHTSGNCGTHRPVPGGSPTDFNGDGRDDIVTFTQNDEADVYVAESTGSEFGGARVWHDFFAPGGETPLTGDFNGDGKDDIVTFTHGEAADVHVALSSRGITFGEARVWHGHFAPGAEVPAVGDVNGDGYDDIITFTQGTEAKVYVALSNGSDGFGEARVWHGFFSPSGEFPALGDVNGDGKDDLITFTQGSTGDVYVALSDGNAFGAGRLVHEHFALAGEQPRVGDVNGDGKDDILTFTQGAESDVYVALSDGNGFGGGQ
ncbi:VCBS repeat domain-containing M23 family metallopeptidase, partial [Streptomyces sp. TRM S81-3]